MVKLKRSQRFNLPSKYAFTTLLTRVWETPSACTTPRMPLVFPRYWCKICRSDTTVGIFFLRQRQKRAPRLNARKLAKPAPAPNPKVHAQFPPVPPTHESVRLALKRGTKPLNLQLRQRTSIAVCPPRQSHESMHHQCPRRVQPRPQRNCPSTAVR